MQLMAGSFKPLHLWGQKVVREDGQHTKAEPVTLHDYFGPHTIRLQRVIESPIKPFTSDMLKVMARVGHLCDTLDVGVRWAIAEPTMTRLSGVKKLTFHLGDVEDVGKLVKWLASPRPKGGRPNLPFLHTLRITCDGGCDLDELVKCFVRRSSLGGKPLTLTYGMPAYWPDPHEIEIAKNKLSKAQVVLHVQRSEEQLLSSEDEGDEDQAPSTSTLGDIGEEEDA